MGFCDTFYCSESEQTPCWSLNSLGYITASWSHLHCNSRASLSRSISPHWPPAQLYSWPGFDDITSPDRGAITSWGTLLPVSPCQLTMLNRHFPEPLPMDGAMRGCRRTISSGGFLFFCFSPSVSVFNQISSCNNSCIFN